MEQIKIDSLNDLLKFAQDLSRELKAGDIVGLSGALGAGKTTLVQLVARSLGIKNQVRSPSFTIVKSYELPKDKRGIKELCHIDLHRLSDIGLDLGLEEYFDNQESVCFIEWAEKIKNKLPKGVVWISLEVRPNGSRLIKKYR